MTAADAVSLSSIGSKTLLAGLLSCATAMTSAQTATAVQAVPRNNAAYVLRDGTVQVVTFAGMAGIIGRLNQLYSSTHPGVRFKVLEGDNYSAMAALTFDRTAFAPLGTAYTRIGLGDNLKIAAEPVGLRIAHASLMPGAGVPALGVIVNANNPQTSLSLAQLVRIFAVGAPSGDIATWGQAGVKEQLADRAIHPFGPLASDYTDSDDPQAGEFLSTDKMSGLNMNHSYTGLNHYTDIVRRVSDDPAAIAITALNVPLNGVKLIALKNTETGAALDATTANIAAGRYPLDRYIYIYLRVGKGMPLDDFGKEYMRMVLSEEGQRVIAEEAAGYIPLNAGELAEERAKLDR